MRAFWFLIAIIVMNGGMFLYQAPLYSNGKSLAYYMGGSSPYDNTTLTTLPSQAGTLTSTENQTLPSQVASSFYVFGDMIGGIIFWITLIATMPFEVSVMLYNYGAPAPWVFVATAITAAVYIASLIEMMSQRQVERS